MLGLITYYIKDMIYVIVCALYIYKIWCVNVCGESIDVLAWCPLWFQVAKACPAVIWSALTTSVSQHPIINTHPTIIREFGGNYV